MTIRLGASAGFTDDPAKTRARLQTLESIGVDVVWVPELYSYDAVSQMGFIAACTERVEIGSSILPFYSRTPTLLAMTAAGLDAVSGGRFILGIGASGPQVVEGWHGVPYTNPVSRVPELIEICRKVWRRELVEHHGDNYDLPLPPERGTGLGKPLKLINRPVREDIPIYVASLGPKNVEMTAELADGWQPVFFYPEKARDVWGKAIDAGTARRDPARGPMHVVAGGQVVIGKGVEHLRDAARPGMALYIGGMGARGKNFYNDLCRRYGFEQEAARIQDLYLDGRKDEAAAAVPQELIDMTSLIGDEGFVRDRIAAYREAGVTVLNVGASGPDAAATLDKVREWTA